MAALRAGPGAHCEFVFLFSFLKAERMIASVDTEGNGSLSFAQFSALMTKVTL